MKSKAQLQIYISTQYTQTHTHTDAKDKETIPYPFDDAAETVIDKQVAEIMHTQAEHTHILAPSVWCDYCHLLSVTFMMAQLPSPFPSFPLSCPYILSSHVSSALLISPSTVTSPLLTPALLSSFPMSCPLHDF